VAINAIIFDFGGVLLQWAPQQIIEGFYSDESLRERLRKQVFGHPDWLELDRGVLDEEAATNRFAARTGRPQEEMQALMETVRDSLTPIDDSIALLRELHAEGIALYGLSNMPASTFSYLRQRYDHWSLMQGIVISGEVKLIKPDAAIFEHICERYQLEPSETIFVDDHGPNIEAARKLNFHGVQFQNADQGRRDIARARGL
jgi:putative hydrolase of the HAD superfamily